MGVFVKIEHPCLRLIAQALERFLSRLKELRKRHALTQERFSELSGIGYKYYQSIEGWAKTRSPIVQGQKGVKKGKKKKKESVLTIDNADKG